jgi:hypothetical protein
MNVELLSQVAYDGGDGNKWLPLIEADERWGLVFEVVDMMCPMFILFLFAFLHSTKLLNKTGYNSYFPVPKDCIPSFRVYKSFCWY